MSSIGSIFGSGMAVILLSGCGLLGNARTVPPEQQASVTVANLSDIAICDVYFAKRSQLTWGRDQLSDPSQIPPARQHTFSLVAGRWSVRMNDCRGRPLYRRKDWLVQGSERLEFRPIEVHRKPLLGARRFAGDYSLRF